MNLVRLAYASDWRSTLVFIDFVAHVHSHRMISVLGFAPEELDPLLHCDGCISIGVNSSDNSKEVHIIEILAMTAKVGTKINCVDAVSIVFINSLILLAWIAAATVEFMLESFKFLGKFDFLLENLSDSFSNVTWQNCWRS